jgi:hypothetical protein
VAHHRDLYPATAVLNRTEFEDLFIPVITPSELVTPGLGHAFGAGRRTRVRRAGQGGDVVELISSSMPWTDPYPIPWAGSDHLHGTVDPTDQLAQAVDEVFAQVSRSHTAELIRPYIENPDTTSVWAGVGVVLPPTPVHGVDTTRIQGAPGVRVPGALPSRRELRERRKAEESARTAATRRLAKGGVLALAMFGAVATQAPQALHQRLFGAPSTVADSVATTLSARSDLQAAAVSLPKDGVEETLRQRLIKKEQVQRVSEAAQDAGGVLVAVAKAQAANDKAVRQAALDRATREAQRNPKALARLMVAERGWSTAQFNCLSLLWTRESNWNYRAINPTSGAYGLAQALPGRKMASAGSDWRTNPATQIEWGLGYIADRYRTPCAAWDHSERNNWY